MNIQEIIRGYDIRGIYPSELQDCYISQIINCLMQSLIEEHQIKQILIGMDNRSNSKNIFDIILKELYGFDIEIIDCGLTTTPALSYSAKLLKSYAIMITASHNHISYNGMKIMKPDIQAVDGSEIRDILSKREYKKNQKIVGCSTKYDCNKFYIDFLIEQFPIFNSIFNSNLSIAWNPLNGNSTLIIKKITQNYQNKNCFINDNIQSLKDNPDPLHPQNIQETKNFIINNNSDIGFSFDADCDRILVFDSNGKTISSEHLIMIFADYLKDKIPNKKVICDTKSSYKLHSFLKNIGYELIIGEIGHSKMKKKLAETGAKFSGEISGHFIFDLLGFDDGLYTALFLLQILNEKNKTINEMIKDLPQIFCSENIRIYLLENEIQNKLFQIKNHVIQNKIIFEEIDGIKIFLSEGWILFRKSMTENCLTIRFESFEEKDFQKIEEFLKEELLLFNYEY